MYCSSCGAPVSSGLSFCNRCGASLKENSAVPVSLTTGLFTSIVLVGIAGIAIMFIGAIALRKGGDLNMDVVGMFMVLTFLLVAMVEFFLLRQLSRVLGGTTKAKDAEPPPPLFQPASQAANELRGTPLRSLAEPLTSVTENTTRTLDHALKDSGR